MTRAVYPGSFDPPTNGHLDIAIRAARLFESLVVGVYDTPPKRLLFTTEERVQMFTQALGGIPNVQVVPYTGLTVDFARRQGAKVIVRGLRATQDFEREFEMALMNKKLAADIEVIFLATSLGYQFLSSSLIKEVVHLGGDVTSLVPPGVVVALRRALGQG